MLGNAHEALHAYALTQAVLGADETRWRMLDGKGRGAGVSKNWQVGVLAAPDAVVYRIEGSRSRTPRKTCSAVSPASPWRKLKTGGEPGNLVVPGHDGRPIAKHVPGRELRRVLRDLGLARPGLGAG